jgi:hypothetical protein
MIQRELTSGGLEVVRDAALVAHLTIGGGNGNGDKIGPGYQFNTPEEALAAARAAAEATRKVTNPKTAFCIDERPIVQLGDTTDPDVLRSVVVAQLPGGTYLAATKAAVAANASIVRDAKDFNEAYSIVAGVLNRAGYEDAGHEGCGASKRAEHSANEQVDPDAAYSTLAAVGVAAEGDQQAVAGLHARKRELVASGFYSAWNPDEHRAKIERTAPQNYSILQTEHDPTHGHHASGIYLPTESGVGFAKNEFTENTGQQLFAYTHGFATELAGHLGGSDEERRMIGLGFGYDLLDVGNQLIAAPDEQTDYPGLAVIQQQPVESQRYELGV